MGCLSRGSASRILAGVCGAGLLSGSQACSVYDSSLLGTGDGGSNVCEHTKWPGPPSGKLGGDTDFVVALHALDFGEPYAPKDDLKHTRPAPPLGYDLDGKCTVNAQSPDPTLTDPNACTPVKEANIGDLPGGRDNALRFILGFFRIYDELTPGYFGTESYNESLTAGDVSLLMQVKGYNGGANDDAVQFIVYVPGRFNQQSGNTGAPAFKGNDKWPISAASYDNNGQPRFTFSGYVTNGELVVQTGNLELPFPAGVVGTRSAIFTLHLQNAVFTAHIAKEGDLYWLKDGQLSGIWVTSEIFQQLQYLPTPSGIGVCMGTQAYPGLQQAVCRSTDMAATSVPSAACNAVSVGIGFEAVQAQLGDQVAAAAAPTDCTSANNPASDSCQNQ